MIKSKRPKKGKELSPEFKELIDKAKELKMYML